MSTPVLLARFDEHKVVSAITAVNGGLAILTIGFFSWLTSMPLIFPALGPSAFILFSSPFAKAAVPRNVIMGHMVSLASGYVAWQMVSFMSGYQVRLITGDWPVFCSAAAAMALSSLLMIRLSCPHPPACASGLIVAMGAFGQQWHLLLMALAVVILTFQAVSLNRFAGLQVPIWTKPHDDNP